MRANKYEWQFDAKIESIKCSAFNVMCLPGSNFINTIGKHIYEIQCRERCCDWRPLSGRWYSIQYSANQCNTIPQDPIKFDEQLNLPNLIRKYFDSSILRKAFVNAVVWSFERPRSGYFLDDSLVQIAAILPDFHLFVHLI